MRVDTISSRSPRFPTTWFAIYVALISVVGTVVLANFGIYWNDAQSLVMGFICWGTAPVVWFLIALSTYVLTGVMLGWTGGAVQSVVSALLVFAVLGAAQFLVLHSLWRLINAAVRRSRTARPTGG